MQLMRITNNQPTLKSYQMNSDRQEHLGADTNNLPVLTETERHQLLIEWNATQTNYPLEKCLHHWIEDQVARTPDAIAVEFADETLSYRELNGRANQLAHYLQAKGITPDTLVGICVERSLEMVIGLLGILKAGGAYVPLDPTYPAERLVFMVQDAQTPVLLSQQHLADLLPQSSAQRVYLDSDWSAIAKASTATPAASVNASNLAYMIYTSGSTGKPKGALNEHRGICNRLLWMQDTFQLDSSDAVLQKTPFSFDVSVWEFFWPLMTGARLVVAKPEGHKDPDYLTYLIQTKHITTLHFVPPMLHVLLDVSDLVHCPSIRRVICSGEALAYELQQSFFAQTKAQLHNLYGPTEAAIDVTHWACREDSPLSIVPIGKPVANTQLYIVDGQGQPTPVGVPGELLIGGVQVGRGYHNRPELTAEKFIANLFVGGEGRLYRTGDLARYLPDGNIEFLGRIDHQVKVHGFRIELGEIEVAMTQHPAVKQAVVLVHQDKLDDKQLVAYFVADLSLVSSKDDAHNYVSLWQNLYEETYKQTSQQTAQEVDLSFNISGWNSSYTDQPIPETQMREWVEQTVARILKLQPQHVLELGCGTGLLLSRIAPHCSSYTGADISATGLDNIRALQKTRNDLDNITLLERAADKLDDFADNCVDTVVINSVIQHFPDADYLLLVLQSAKRLVKAGGRIFLGDVPSLLQREAFHVSVQLFRADDGDTCGELWQGVRQKMDAEKDLQFAPAFFFALKQYLPEISHVQIIPKPGRSHNQLTLFRYDVILQLEGSGRPIADLDWRDWQADHLSVAATQALLTGQHAERLAIRGIPNARLAAVTEALSCLRTATADTPIKEVRNYLAQQSPVGIEPEDLAELAAANDYNLELSWLNGDSDGAFDAVFTRKDLAYLPAVFVSEQPRQTLSQYVNNPQQIKLTRQLMKQLRALLQESLPEYMVPAIFTRVEAMPLSPSGKIDRKALAELPVEFEFIREEAMVAAHNPFEKLLADVWADVLDLPQIGVEDNFFALGGNSLKVMTVANRLQRLFGEHIPPLGVFIAPTVSSFAVYLLALYPELATNGKAPDYAAEREEGEI